MGDMSAEPSMEDILSSIKRIISEEGDNGAPQRPRRVPAKSAPLAAVPVGDPSAVDEVLELHDPMPVSTPLAAPPSAPVVAAAARPDQIASSHTAQAARGALDSLSRLLVKPEPDSDGTLEGLVREMLRPMLREWIDANLPQLVETLVAREIARITGENR